MCPVQIALERTHRGELCLEFTDTNVGPVEVRLCTGQVRQLCFEFCDAAACPIQVTLHRTHECQLALEFTDASVGSIQVGPNLSGVCFECCEPSELRLGATELSFEVDRASAGDLQFGRCRAHLCVKVSDPGLRAVELSTNRRQ